MQKEERCILCGAARPGLAVREDFVIGSIRWFKRNVAHNEKGYSLVVCRECYPKYKKALASYRRKQVAYVAIGIIFMALLIVLSQDKFLAALSGIAIVAFMYLLSLLSYMPSVSIPESAHVAATENVKKRTRHRKGGSRR